MRERERERGTGVGAGGADSRTRGRCPETPPAPWTRRRRPRRKPRRRTPSRPPPASPSLPFSPTDRIRPQPLFFLLPSTDSHRSSMQIIQCNKIGLKRWLQLVGLGGNGGVRARARLGDSHGWMALHVFLPHSLRTRTHTGKGSLVSRPIAIEHRVGLCAHTGPTIYFETL